METQLPQLSELPALLSTWAGNFTNQTSSMFSRMGPKDWIRLIMVIGGYVLMRPYLVTMGAKFQQKQFEKQQNQEKAEAEERLQAKAAKAGIDPNVLRGVRKMDIPGVDSDSEDEEREEEAAEWGRKARVRQRQHIRRAMEEQERRLHEKATESDKEIEDLLEE